MARHLRPLRLALSILGVCFLAAAAPAQKAAPPGSDLRAFAAKRFPQPVRVGDLIQRTVLEPVESQPILGHVVDVVRFPNQQLAIVIKYGGPVSVDAFASFAVAAILIAAAYRLARDATLVLLEAAPPHVPVGAVREAILGFEGIAEVHDLHVWTLGAGHDAITTHVRAKTVDPTLARRLSHALREAFDTEYVTVQVESFDEGCAVDDEPV